MFKTSAIQVLVAFLLFNQWGFSQQTKPPSLDRSQQKAVIDEVSKLLIDNYIFPDVATKMQELIQKKLKDGSYDKLTLPGEFANAVYEDLLSISKDKHLNFRYGPLDAKERAHLQSQNEQEAKEARDRRIATLKQDNYGFRKVERLGGNTGYLDFHFFAIASEGGETAVAALAFLANCDAIIIDLRENGGGDPTQIQLISSYFFQDPVHLNDIYTRRENKTENFWTLPYVPGKKMPNVDLYILTSGHTFSGAEEFSYNMKNLKRATLIGETTGGGAHPNDVLIVQKEYLLAVPYARAINPITKTNWEGTGVKPDIEIPANQAFDKAYQMAIEKLYEKTSDPQRKQELGWIIAGQKAKLNPVQLSEETLKKYAGIYEQRKITFENGQLYYQRTGPKFRLVPMTETIFGLEGMDDFRLEFTVKDGKTTEVTGLYDNGEREPSKRTE